jgi:hypothetical protein
MERRRATSDASGAGGGEAAEGGGEAAEGSGGGPLLGGLACGLSH